MLGFWYGVEGEGLRFLGSGLRFWDLGFEFVFVFRVPVLDLNFVFRFWFWSFGFRGLN